MASIYLAGRFSKRFLHQGYRGELQRRGHTVTSRWIDIATENEGDALKCARIDLEDLNLSDTVIAFGDVPRSTRSRGGHWVEYGYALASGHRIMLVEYRENIFGHLPEIEFFDSWPKALDALTPMRKAA